MIWLRGIFAMFWGGDGLKGGREDLLWCRWWLHKPGPLWCPCRSHICSSSTHSQSGRPVPRKWKQRTYMMTFSNIVTTFHYYWGCSLWSHPFIKVRDDDSRDASYHNLIQTSVTSATVCMRYFSMQVFSCSKSPFLVFYQYFNQGNSSGISSPQKGDSSTRV